MSIKIYQPTNQEKQNWLKWVKTVDKYSEIAQCAKEVNQYFETSCLLTAAILRKRLTNQLNWIPTFENLTNEFIKNHTLFQIEFGFLCSMDFNEHIITVCEGIIYQSFWKKTKWDVRPVILPDNFVRDKFDLIPVDVISKLIGFEIADVFNSGGMGYRILLPNLTS